MKIMEKINNFKVVISFVPDSRSARSDRIEIESVIESSYKRFAKAIRQDEDADDWA